MGVLSHSIPPMLAPRHFRCGVLFIGMATAPAEGAVKVAHYPSHAPGDGHWRDGSTLERRGFSGSLGNLRATEGGKSFVNARIVI